MAASRESAFWFQVPPAQEPLFGEARVLPSPTCRTRGRCLCLRGGGGQDDDAKASRKHELQQRGGSEGKRKRKPKEASLLKILLSDEGEQRSWKAYKNMPSANQPDQTKARPEKEGPQEYPDGQLRWVCFLSCHQPAPALA